jgi:hypothetical protein
VIGSVTSGLTDGKSLKPTESGSVEDSTIVGAIVVVVKTVIELVDEAVEEVVDVSVVICEVMVVTKFSGSIPVTST